MAFPLPAAINLWWVVIQMLVALAVMWWLASLRVAPLTALLGGAEHCPQRKRGYAFCRRSSQSCCLLSMGLSSGRGMESVVGWQGQKISCFIRHGMVSSPFFGAYSNILSICNLVGIAHHYGRGDKGKICLWRWLRGMAFVVGLGSLAAAVLLFPQIEFGLATSLLVAAFLVFELISKRKGCALHQRTISVTAAPEK